MDPQTWASSLQDLAPLLHKSACAPKLAIKTASTRVHTTIKRVLVPYHGIKNNVY